MNWNNIFGNKNVEEMWNEFRKRLEEQVQKHAPTTIIAKRKR